MRLPPHFAVMQVVGFSCALAGLSDVPRLARTICLLLEIDFAVSRRNKNGTFTKHHVFGTSDAGCPLLLPTLQTTWLLCASLAFGHPSSIG